MSTKRWWPVCLLSLTAGTILEGVAKYCYSRAASLKAQSVTITQTVRTFTGSAGRGYLQMGYGIEAAGAVLALAGCLAWRNAVKNDEAGTAVIPIVLIAIFVILFLMAV